MGKRPGDCGGIPLGVDRETERGTVREQGTRAGTGSGQQGPGASEKAGLSPGGKVVVRSKIASP